MINDLYMQILKEIPAVQDELQKYIIDMFVENACAWNKSGKCENEMFPIVKCHDCKSCNVRHTIKIALTRLASIDNK